MSDSNESGVTYTDVSSPFEELSNIGSPGADDHEYLELLEMLEDPYVEVAIQAPPSPDYIHGPEDLEQAPPFPDYDLEAHPEDDDDEDPEEDPVDYPADGGDDGNDEEWSSEDDEDDDMNIEADEMFFEESDKIEKYIGGLPDMIHGSVVASKPKIMQEAVEIATELMDKKIRTFVERETASKRKFKNTLKNTQNQQQQSNKRQNTGWVYTATSGEKKQYGGSKPLCAKCNYHHDGPCAPKCHNCNKVGHFARDCKNTTNTNNANNQRGAGLGQKPTCYECGIQGHFKRECPKLKNNNNHGNQGGRNNAPARVYAVGHAGIDPDANVMTGTFLLNNRYAYVLFDTGADKSFVSTTFSTQINITPSTLDHCYDVELADGRIIGLNTILRGCTLNLLNHPFNINLMPVELGSFDAIIGTDWLTKYQAVIACAEKIVRIPWGNETLIIHGDGSNQGNATRLNIILCTKTEKYMMKGFPIILAHITTKEVEDKSEKKRLEDVPIVQNFPEVFPEDLPVFLRLDQWNFKLI
nr:reverse transcriptase domain-containing protein [Tanacetum cinerariifolium]